MGAINIILKSLLILLMKGNIIINLFHLALKPLKSRPTP